MGFNYGLEKKKFDREWDKLREEYRAADMDEASIDVMYEFDWHVFNSERAYQNHTQRMPECAFSDVDGEDDSYSPLLKKFVDSFAVMPQESDSGNRYGWVDEIEAESLSEALKQLSPEDIELLTLHVFEGLSWAEIAKMRGVTKAAMSQRLKRFKKIVKTFLEQP